MRTLLFALIGVVVFSAVIWNQKRAAVPTVSAETVSVSEVRRQREAGAVTSPASSPDTLIVERPSGATEGSPSSVFVVAEDGLSQRVPVQYGRASVSLIEVTNGLSSGDRIIISDMRAWDAFDRIQLRSQ